MKLTIITTEGEWGQDSGLELKLETNTKEVNVEFSEGEPEDMTLERDLNDVYSLEELVEAAYEAGKRGESYEVNHLEED